MGVDFGSAIVLWMPTGFRLEMTCAARALALGLCFGVIFVFAEPCDVVFLALALP